MLSILTQKLIAAVGLAGDLLLGVSGDSAANPWRGHCAPVYRAPAYVPAPPVVVHQAPVYRPAYRPVVWRQLPRNAHRAAVPKAQAQEVRAHQCFPQASTCASNVGLHALVKAVSLGSRVNDW